MPRWREAVTGLDAIIDANTMDFRSRRAAWKNCLSLRYPLLMLLQRLYLTAPPFMRNAAAAAQKLLLGSLAAQQPFCRDDGRPQTILPLPLVLGRALPLGPGDVVLSAGSDWLHKGTAVPALQRRFNFQLAVICYDLLPLLRPEFFPPAELPRYKEYWHTVLPAASRILCNSHRIAQDIANWAAQEGLSAVPAVVVPLGYTAPGIARLPELRAPLRAGRFALFVSTVEPRKGHHLLLRAWRRLLAAGIPQRQDFRLVFVGRPGWMVDSVLAQLDGSDEIIGDTVLHLRGVADKELEKLYQDAAFCLYPSLYEGFGLPPIEAFAHGKAVIASTGGAVPETVAGLSPCIDALDEDAWVETLGEWIENAEAHAFWERKIAADFHHKSWTEAAESILHVAYGC
jgi:glycosyltransferase involved in cell wall biosynthesis